MVQQACSTDDETTDYTPDDLARRIAEIVENRGDDSEEFKTNIKRACRTARAHGLTEEQIRTQLAAKADAMEAALDAAADDDEDEDDEPELVTDGGEIDAGELEAGDVLELPTDAELVVVARSEDRHGVMYEVEKADGSTVTLRRWHVENALESGATVDVRGAEQRAEVSVNITRGEADAAECVLFYQYRGELAKLVEHVGGTLYRITGSIDELETVREVLLEGLERQHRTDRRRDGARRVVDTLEHVLPGQEAVSFPGERFAWDTGAVVDGPRWLTASDDVDDATAGGEDAAAPVAIADGGQEVATVLEPVEPDEPLAEQVSEGDMVTIEYVAKATGTRQERTGEVVSVTPLDSGLDSQGLGITVEGYSYDKVKVRTWGYSGDEWASVGTSSEGVHSSSSIGREIAVYVEKEAVCRRDECELPARERSSYCSNECRNEDVDGTVGELVDPAGGSARTDGGESDVPAKARRFVAEAEASSDVERVEVRRHKSLPFTQIQVYAERRIPYGLLRDVRKGDDRTIMDIRSSAREWCELRVDVRIWDYSAGYAVAEPGERDVEPRLATDGGRDVARVEVAIAIEVRGEGVDVELQEAGGGDVVLEATPTEPGATDVVEPDGDDVVDGAGDGGEESGGSRGGEYEALRDGILELLEREQEVVSGEIGEDIDADSGYWRAVLKDLREEGLVESRRDPRDGRRNLYRLAGADTLDLEPDDEADSEGDDEEGVTASSGAFDAVSGPDGEDGATSTDGGGAAGEHRVGDDLSSGFDGTRPSEPWREHGDDLPAVTDRDLPSGTSVEEIETAARREDVHSLTDLAHELGLQAGPWKQSLRVVAAKRGLYDGALDRPEGRASDE